MSSRRGPVEREDAGQKEQVIEKREVRIVSKSIYSKTS